jgi:hypothetical protein
LVYTKAVNRSATAQTVKFEPDGARKAAGHVWLTGLTSNKPAPSKIQPAFFIR